MWPFSKTFKAPPMPEVKPPKAPEGNLGYRQAPPKLKQEREKMKISYALNMEDLKEAIQDYLYDKTDYNHEDIIIDVKARQEDGTLVVDEIIATQEV